MAMLGLLRNDAVSDSRFVPLSDRFTNALRFTRNNFTFIMYEQSVFGCIIEYIRENDQMALDDKGALEFIIEVLVECEIKHSITSNNERILHRHITEANMIKDQYEVIYERKITKGT